MASFTKRGSAWRVQVARMGRRVTATFDTRAEAEVWARAMETRLLAGEQLTPAAAPAMTVEALFDRYAREVSPGKGGSRWEAVRLKSLPATFALFRGAVATIDGPALADWRDERLRTVAPSTVNRELNLISAVFTRALREWRVPGLVANPVHAIQRPKDPAPRNRRIADDEKVLILAALGWDEKRQPAQADEWIAWSFCFALETAMRKGEILGMLWSHVHLNRQHVHLPKTKNGEARDVPLSKAAMALFELLEPCKGAVVPVASGTFDTMFRRARTACGLTGLHFHDSRREAATRFAEFLTVMELAAVTGHRDVRTLARVYYQPDVRGLANKLG